MNLHIGLFLDISGNIIPHENVTKGTSNENDTSNCWNIPERRLMAVMAFNGLITVNGA